MAAVPAAERPKTSPKSVKFLFGGLAGMGATVFVQPLDLVKNRMQLSGAGAKGREYRTSLHALGSILRHEGLRGIYTGLSAGLLRQATYTTTRLGIYSVLLERFGGADGTPPPFLAKAAMGMTAGAAGAFVGTPAEVALIRMTADGRSRGYRFPQNLPLDVKEQQAEDVTKHVLQCLKLSTGGIWLICGDRAWRGLPSKIDGGPCALGQLKIIAPSVKEVVKKKSRKIRSSWGHQYESNCDSDFHSWNSGKSIAASIFLPQWGSSAALTQLNKLGCWLSKEVNATSTAISDLLTDEEAVRHATLQNRAAIDFLLLAHGHGCEDFEGLRCTNSSDHSASIHKQLQNIKDLANQITIGDPSWLDSLFDGWSFCTLPKGTL